MTCRPQKPCNSNLELLLSRPSAMNSPPVEITEQSPQTAADSLPEISELSAEQVTEESSLINSKEQNLQLEVKTTANKTQQDEQKVQIIGNLHIS